MLKSIGDFAKNIATTVNVQNPAGDHRKGKPYKLQPHFGESYLVQFNTMKVQVSISHQQYQYHYDSGNNFSKALFVLVVKTYRV